MTALRGKLFSDCGGLQFGVGGMTTTSACDGSGLIILAGGEQRLTITRLRATHQQVRSPAP